MTDRRKIGTSIAIGFLALAIVVGAFNVNLLGAVITYLVVSLATFEFLSSIENSAKTDTGDPNKRD